MDENDLTAVAAAICGAEGFSLGASLGSGAFKRVFRADHSSGQVYALKILRDPLPSDRVLREAEALRRCDHSHIARLHKLETYAHEQSEYTFILEEYLAGGSLASRVEEVGLLDRDTTLVIGMQLIEALEHLAARGLVHRDIKPENIMFRDANNQPVLVDFGLVRDLTAPSLTHTWQDRGPGTPYFAAPEQLNNEKRLIDWRTDQFSLGISLAFCHYGKHPFQEDEEPMFSSRTVERVARHGQRNPSFFAATIQDRLGCLQQMTTPWPVQRFRRPSQLAVSWRAQDN